MPLAQVRRQCRTPFGSVVNSPKWPKKASAREEERGPSGNECEIEQAGWVPRLVCSYASQTLKKNIVILSAVQQVKCYRLITSGENINKLKEQATISSPKKVGKKKSEKCVSLLLPQIVRA